jgi:uncharacterized protein
MNIKSNKKSMLLAPGGFVVLFLIYHLPEFLQNHYQKPLILVLESGMLLFTITAFLFGRQWHRNGFRIYGLHSLRKNKRNLIIGLLSGILIAGVANMIPVWLHWSEISIQVNWTQILLLLLLFALGTLLPSLAEDILTRGYLRIFWPESWNLYWLIPFSALVYALNHIFRLGKPDVMLYLFALGFLLMWCYVKTGTLWLTLGIHWGSNMCYQFFTNLIILKSVKETGMENYVLAVCYASGILLIILMQKLKLFVFESRNASLQK